MSVSAQKVQLVNPNTGATYTPLDPVALPTGTDRSGTIITGGTAQPLASANTSRQSLTGQNISDTVMWINEVGGTATAGAAGSYSIAAGSSFRINTNQAVSIVCATAGKAFTATEV